MSRSRLLSDCRLSEGLHPAALRAAAAAAAFGDPFGVEAAPMAHQQAGCDVQQPAVGAPLEQSQASPDEAPRSLGECPPGMQQWCRAVPGIAPGFLAGGQAPPCLSVHIPRGAAA